MGAGLLPIEHEAGRWAGRGSRIGAGLGVLGAGLGMEARRQQAGRWACWRWAHRQGAGTAWACWGAQGVWRAAGA